MQIHKPKTKIKVVYWPVVDHTGIIEDIPVRISFINECDECGTETNNLKETAQGDLCEDCMNHFNIDPIEE